MRPTKRTKAITDDIIDKLSSGIPLAEICRQEGYPHPSTVRDWMAKDESLSLAIARAREDGEDIIAINTRNTARGVEGFSSGDIQRDKLIIETDLKLLAKFNPKKYGDKLNVGGDPENPIKHTHDVTLTPDEAYKQLLHGK